MIMTTDLEEGSKLHTSMWLTGTPCPHPHSDSALVWASGESGGLSGNCGAAAVVHWERGRGGGNYRR